MSNQPDINHDLPLCAFSSSEKIKILYQDSHLIVCIKPYGILSESHGMPELVEQACQHCVFCVHRLDKDVGGIMTFAKDSRTASLLSSQTADVYQKEYLAVISGSVPEQAEFHDLLFHDKNRNKTYVVDRMRKGVKEAVLSYKLLDCQDQMSLVLVHLQTGRTHQIRVQFASRKHPLIGDAKYGSPIRTGKIGLWAYRITFVHPYTGKSMTFSELPPDTDNWHNWKNVMDSALPEDYSKRL